MSYGRGALGVAFGVGLVSGAFGMNWLNNESQERKEAAASTIPGQTGESLPPLTNPDGSPAETLPTVMVATTLGSVATTAANTTLTYSESGLVCTGPVKSAPIALSPEPFLERSIIYTVRSVDRNERLHSLNEQTVYAYVRDTARNNGVDPSSIIDYDDWPNEPNIISFQTGCTLDGTVVINPIA